VPRLTDPGIDTDEAIHVAAFRAGLRAFERTSEEIAQANGLTPRRHLLLLMIKGAPDGTESASITDLVDRLRLAQSTVTELVQRAVDAGLLLRERSVADARVGNLRLSAEGERRLARVFRSHDAEREKLHEMLVELESASREEVMPRRGA
jgi:DNA-binding MarR family transcriptional regulator